MPASHPRRAYYRFVVALLVLNLAGWIIFARSSRREINLLQVTRFDPAEAIVDQPRPTFRWQFNLDLDDASRAIKRPLQMRPELPGTFSWADRRTLLFVPEQALPRATQVQFTLPREQFRSTEGCTLAKAQTFEKQTTPLKLLSARQARFDPDRRIELQLEFNDAVSPADLTRALSLSLDKESLAATVIGDKSQSTLTVLTAPLPESFSSADAQLKLTLAAGLAGVSGPLTTATATRLDVPISADLMLVDVDPNMPGDGEATIRLRFNGPFSVNDLRPLISCEPPVNLKLEQSSYDSSLILRGDFKPASRYAISIADRPKSADPIKFPRGDRRSIFVPDRPTSLSFKQSQGYLGSAGSRTLDLGATNCPEIVVSVARLYDNNIALWQSDESRSRYFRSDSIERFAKPIASKTFNSTAAKNQPDTLRIALDELLGSRAADGVYVVTARAGGAASDTTRQRYRYDDALEDSTVVTLSDLALTAHVADTQVTAWVTSLRAGTPRAGIDVEVFSQKHQTLGKGATNAEGLVSLTIAPAEDERPAVVIARENGSSSLTWLKLDRALRDDTADVGGARYLREGYEAFVYAERNLFRPGETANLRAIVRGPDGKVPPTFPVQWQLRSGDGRVRQAAKSSLDQDGYATWTLQLPDVLPTGVWTVALGLPEAETNAAFGQFNLQVEEFVPQRIRFAAKFVNEQQQPLATTTLTQPFAIAVQADYLFGQPCADLAGSVQLRIEPARFKSIQFPAYTFGDTANATEAPSFAREAATPIDFQTSSSGHATVRVDPIQVIKPAGSTSVTATGPWTLIASAEVREVGGRAVNQRVEIPLHSVDHYIGLRAAARAGSSENIDIDLAAVAVAGGTHSQPLDVEVSLLRERWSTARVVESGRTVYRSQRTLEPVDQTPSRSLRLAGTSKLSFGQVPPGRYVATVREAATGQLTSCAVDVTSRAWDDTLSRSNPQRLEIEVLPVRSWWVETLLASVDRPRLSGIHAALKGTLNFLTPLDPRAPLTPGEYADVIIRAPFPGTVLLSTQTDRVLDTRVIVSTKSSSRTRIRLPRDLQSNAYLSAALVRGVDPSSRESVFRAFGAVPFNVDCSDRRLRIEIASPNEIRPERSLPVIVRVTDAGGSPVRNAAVTIDAVDEGIFALTGYRGRDPFDFFTRKRALAVSLFDAYGDLFPDTDSPSRVGAIGGDGDDELVRRSSPVSAKRVKPVSFAGSVIHTDPQGYARTDFPLPSFNGKLRVSATAARDRASGAAESGVQVRAPLVMQSNLPRFAAPGDTFTSSILLVNSQPRAMDVMVNVSVTSEIPGLLTLSGADKASVHIPASASSVVNLNLTAARAIGTATIRFTATADGETTSELIELPIRPAAAITTRSQHLIANTGSPTTLPAVADFLPGTARYSIAISSTPNLAIPDGLDYLDQYPYGCAEQITSTAFPLLYLRDLGSAIDPTRFDQAHINEKVEFALHRLMLMQLGSGAVAMWPGSREAWPWASIYVAHFAVSARAAGFTVPESLHEGLLRYCRDQLSRASDAPETLERQAYAAYVLALAGEPDVPAMARLGDIVARYTPVKSELPLSPQVRFHLAAGYLAIGMKDRTGELIPTNLPEPRPGRALGDNLGSPIRDRAIMLSTLLKLDPNHPATANMVEQLVADGRNGQWRSTQDVAFAVMSLGEYARLHRDDAKYDLAELWIGNQSVARSTGDSPTRWAGTTAPTGDIRLAGSAKSKAFVRVTAEGIPTSQPSKQSNGITVTKRLLDRNGKELTSTQLVSGDLVWVELTFDSPQPGGIAIEDLLPAGLEIENPRLISADDGRIGRPDRAVVDDSLESLRVDVRDDRLILLGKLPASGHARHRYLARAVTPGRFVLPATRAEMMYDFGIFGSTDTATLTILPAPSGRESAPMANTDN